MRSMIAFLILATLAACQVTTSQGMGSGVTFRSDAPIGDRQATDDQDNDDQGTDDQGTEDQGVEATQDRMQGLTIGGGFSTGVSN